MRIVVAPDSFKGSLSSMKAAEAIEAGILEVFKDAEVVKVPIADGGEGTVASVVAMTHGKIVKTVVQGPLGEKVTASWGRCQNDDGEFAVIEMAEASGLLLEKESERNVLKASTYGTGQLIKAALDVGIRKIIIGIGGSATNDGGAGLAEALGAKFYDKNNRVLPRGGAALANLEYIEISDLDPRLKFTDFYIASDVKNPLCGKNGASYVYGPQKGASPSDVELLDAALERYSKIAARDVGRDVKDIPGAGAAGGLGAGLMLFSNGHMCNGIEMVLKLGNFESYLKDADLVFTGEGFSDAQTKNGKAPVGVAAVAKKHNLPVICLSGGISSDATELLFHGIDAISGTPCAPISLEQCIKNAKQLLQQAAARCCLLLKVGSKLHL